MDICWSMLPPSHGLEPDAERWVQVNGGCGVPLARQDRSGGSVESPRPSRSQFGALAPTVAHVLQVQLDCALDAQPPDRAW